MVRLLDKNWGGGHGTAGVRAMASGIGIEGAMCRQAAQGADVAEPTSVARRARDARGFGATLPGKVWSDYDVQKIRDDMRRKVAKELGCPCD